ncbi:MAG: hypothetical protein KKC39_08200 [Candidatus Omnitrophica bacterium]|nr:hypothetical protein [Candidatus Omnitrophota bacterium]MBU4302823.1 hypothetical protein [Candidatus Omnitrophota bacterium]MBU4468698.1 hypothetical protein [Candidatus Omnitrophota bacterium]
MRIYPKNAKLRARHLRSKGWSLGEIDLKMHISKNTLCGWVKDIKLSNKQKKRIKQKIIDSGKIGRPLAVAANRRKIQQWKESIRNSVKHFENISLENPKLGKLICGLLYLCEGAKYPSSRYLYLGNSDPKIISFFINALRRYYEIDENKLRFSIGYRWDQNFQKLKNYWSKITKIPKSKCLNSIPDMRTKGKPTLKKNYMGICRIVYYNATLQFELQSIGETVIKGGCKPPFI